MEYVPEPVINGFTIAANQVADLSGMTVEAPAAFLPKIAVLWEARDIIHPASLATGLLTMVLIAALRRAWPRFPGLVVAVSATSALAVLLNLPVETRDGR
ncbi:hypothetical protein KTN05_03800 [Paracoccus sp. Z118]|uniref:hypothetical protein n=1 Tax=Paracoccus sp. Z118 TaxID=2851017 RepID=UPI001C2BF9D6|nr:hypothetical protein [Paracoccus sp. Z118]MBV0890971.1 hypothetical protein [Paracoccus sp. Z118]